MRYCPKCGAEYVDQAQQCSDCGVALVDQPPVSKKDQGASNEDLVAVFKPENRVELELACEALEEQGISYRVADHESLSGLLSAGIALVNIQIEVPADQQEQAREVIDEALEAAPADAVGEEADEDDEDDDAPEIVRYCHNCAVDYRIDIATCQICGELLKDHPPTDKELEGVVAWEPLSKIQLDIVGPELEAEGIAFSAIDLTPAGDYVGESVTAPQIQVRVPPGHVEIAREIISEAIEGAELPEDFDPGEPTD